MSKKPAQDSILVHEEHGGHHERIDVTNEARDAGQEALRAAQSILGFELRYGRADLLRHNGQLVLSAFEITEPQLYFNRIPNHAALFAKALKNTIDVRLGHEGKQAPRVAGEL